MVASVHQAYHRWVASVRVEMVLVQHSAINVCLSYGKIAAFSPHLSRYLPRHLRQLSTTLIDSLTTQSPIHSKYVSEKCKKESGWLSEINRDVYFSSLSYYASYFICVFDTCLIWFNTRIKYYGREESFYTSYCSVYSDRAFLNPWTACGIHTLKN